MANLKIEIKVTEQNDNNQVRQITVPAMVFDQGEGQVNETQIDDNSIATPVSVTLSEFANTDLIIIWATYRDTDDVLGVTAGDLASIEIDVNGSGIWQKIEGVKVLPSIVTSIAIRKATADGTILRVKRVINGKGI